MEESDKAPPQQQPQPQQVGGEPMNMSMAVATADLMANIVAAPQPISTTTSEEATTTSKPPAAAASSLHYTRRDTQVWSPLTHIGAQCTLTQILESHSETDLFPASDANL